MIHALTIPTVYTAVDRMSPVQARIAAMNNRIAATSVNVQRSLTAGASRLGALFGVTAGGYFTTQAIMNYEDELANLKALTGATTEEFNAFKVQIAATAAATKKSSVEVAQAFSTIANAKPELLSDAAALSQVTKSSILLAQAARMELAPAGEAVTDIMNQFGLKAAQVTKLVDLLAAGSVAGSSEIRDTSEAIKQFGTVAANSGVQINEAIAAIELVSRFEKGAEAGVKLRNVLLEMSKGFSQDPKALASMQRLGVNIALVSDRTKPFVQRLHEMAKVANDNTAIMQIFGKENAALATGLLQNSYQIEDYIEKVGTVGVASQMAAENTNTLRERVNQMIAKWVTLTTTSKGAGVALNGVKSVLGFITDNMETLLNVIIPLGSAFLAYRGYVWGSVIAMTALDKASKIYMFTAGFMGRAITGMNVALLANETYMKGAAAATNLLGVSVSSALGWVGLLGAALGILYLRTNDAFDATQRLVGGVEEMDGAFKKVRNPVTDAEIGLSKYNKAVDDYNAAFNELKHRQWIEKHQGVMGVLAYKAANPSQLFRSDFQLMRQIAYGEPTKEKFLSKEEISEVERVSGKGPTTTNQTITNHYVIDLKQDGKTVGTISSADAMPNVPSTFRY